MDPTEILNVRFHIGGEFMRIGPNMDYVGGEEAMSEIERDKLSLQEVNGFLKDHIQFKESMKLYFLLPGKELINGLVFLYDDSGCVKMADYICVGGVADVYVEYHGEEDSAKSSSGSDFEDEFVATTDIEPDVVMIAAEPGESDTDVIITDGTGVVREVMCSPLKLRKRSGRNENVDEHPSQASGSCSASQPQPQPTRTSAPATGRNSAPATATTRTSAPHAQQASAPGTNANKFKPPRKRAATTAAGSSSVTAPGASTSIVRGTGAKRGRRRVASSVPSYQYFTCSGNY
ncbi:hypothetical protein D1007_20763 [Hordeum vulgare]|nr:hypothetical protein D1007_20763 [Hordeum vulgare]